MTDKQIIIDEEKFEKAENEPINQEAVNKFIEETDKFYIDGVDVSGCCHYVDGKCTNSHMIQSNCKNVAVCYYKEYKRKEQECEGLGQAYLETNELLQEKTKECTNLKAENEELKEINQELLKYRKHSTTCQECYEDGLEDGKTSNKELRKLRKTLAEIKKIAENNKHSVLCFTAFEGDSIEVNNKPMAVILQKINEVENDL